MTLAFDATRRGLHIVAEHVLGAARYKAVGRIGLEVSPGGFATPAFDGRILRVEGTELVVEDPSGERRAPLTTVAAAAALAGVEPGMPETVYRPATPLAPEAPLGLDSSSAAELARRLGLADEALRAFAAEVVPASPPTPTLWPEHFDVGITLDKVNYGGSPGDDAIDEPYLYVGPWARPLPDNGFWNQSFGAVRTMSEIGDVDAALAFYRAGRAAAG